MSTPRSPDAEPHTSDAEPNTATLISLTHLLVSRRVSEGVAAAGYPVKADPDRMNRVGVVLVLAALMVLVAMVYGPLGAALVEMFPTRIRYTAMSLPYHLGNGWFGGFMPLATVAVSMHFSSEFAGLVYPTAMALLCGLLALRKMPETRHRDIGL